MLNGISESDRLEYLERTSSEWLVSYSVPLFMVNAGEGTGSTSPVIGRESLEFSLVL